MKFVLVKNYKRINMIIKSLSDGDFMDVPKNKNDKRSKITREIFYFLIQIRYIVVRDMFREGVLRANINVQNPKYFTFWSMLRLYYLNLSYRKNIEKGIGAIIVALIIAYLTHKLGFV